MQSPNNRIEEAIGLMKDLQAIHKHRYSSINPPRAEIMGYIAEIEILKYFAAYPHSTAYEIYNNKIYTNRKKPLIKDEHGNDRDYRWIRKRISNFAEIGLLERTQKPPSQHKAKSCKLTTSGLVYLILEREIMENDVIKGILKYYSNNPLFQLFVYPYIKLDTLQRLTTLNSLLPVSSFLYECCRELKDAVSTINAARSKDVIGGYLVWQSIPDDKYATNRLCEFLKRELGLKWLDYAKFEKIGNGNTLRISHQSTSISIVLNENRTKAFLRMKGEIKLELTVREFTKENENSKGCFVIEIPAEITISERAAILIGYVQSRVPYFVFSLVLNVTTASDDFRILSQDKTFLDTLEKTKTEFIDKCEILARMQMSLFHDRF